MFSVLYFIYVHKKCLIFNLKHLCDDRQLTNTIYNKLNICASVVYHPKVFPEDKAALTHLLHKDHSFLMAFLVILGHVYHLGCHGNHWLEEETHWKKRGSLVWKVHRYDVQFEKIWYKFLNIQNKVWPTVLYCIICDLFPRDKVGKNKFSDFPK